MSKSKEELSELKKEVESLYEKLNELAPEELEQVTGGKGVIPAILAQKISEFKVPIKSGQHIGLVPSSGNNPLK